MQGISRRTFIQRTSAGIAAAAAVVTLPIIGSSSRSTKTQASNTARSTGALQSIVKPAATDSIVAHISDASSGEIRLFFGEHEIIHHDPSLVSQIFAATQTPA